MLKKKKVYTMENPHPDFKKRSDAVAVAITGYDELCKLCKNTCKNPPLMVKCALFTPKSEKAYEKAIVVQRGAKRLALKEFYKHPTKPKA